MCTNFQQFSIQRFSLLISRTYTVPRLNSISKGVFRDLDLYLWKRGIINHLHCYFSSPIHNEFSELTPTNQKIFKHILTNSSGLVSYQKTEKNMTYHSSPSQYVRLSMSCITYKCCTIFVPDIYNILIEKPNFSVLL